MRHFRVVLLVWLVTGSGAGLGALLGRIDGHQGTYLGAIVGGTLAILLAMRFLTGLGWLDMERRRGGSIGGLCAFALAAPLAATTLDTLWIPLLAGALVGIGVLVGAGRGAVR